jgi:hypothetical protein
MEDDAPDRAVKCRSLRVPVKPLRGCSAPTSLRPFGTSLSSEAVTDPPEWAAAPLVKPRSAGYLPHGSEVPRGPIPLRSKGLTIHPALRGIMRNSSKRIPFSTVEPSPRVLGPLPGRHWCGRWSSLSVSRTCAVRIGVAPKAAVHDVGQTSFQAPQSFGLRMTPPPVCAGSTHARVDASAPGSTP